MNTRLKIDLSQGTLEAEGEESFVQRIYDDFKARLGTDSKLKPNPPIQDHLKKVDPEGTGIVLFDTLAECLTAAAPQTDSEYALVAGAYFQAKEALDDISAQQVNKGLTHTGHGVGNITEALRANIDHAPQYVIQIAKSGKTRQARKKYKVTTAGFAEVERMIAAAAQQLQAPQNG